jgi:hypothetical protein
MGKGPLELAQEFQDDDFNPEWEEEKLLDEVGIIPYAKGTTLGQVIKNMQSKYKKIKPERVDALIRGDGYLGFKADDLNEPWDAFLDRMHKFYDEN